jgi:hypothetical protein
LLLDNIIQQYVVKAAQHWNRGIQSARLIDGPQQKKGERHGLNGALCLLPFFILASRILGLKTRSAKTKRREKCVRNGSMDTADRPSQPSRLTRRCKQLGQGGRIKKGVKKG